MGYRKDDKVVGQQRKAGISPHTLSKVDLHQINESEESTSLHLCPLFFSLSYSSIIMFPKIKKKIFII